MLMSEAILLGSMLRPQCITWLFIAGRSCAIGAALEAIGFSAEWIMARALVRDGCRQVIGYVELADACGTTFWIDALTPGDLSHSDTLFKISARNDRGESRESIAQWLRESGLDFAVRGALEVEETTQDTVTCSFQN